MAGRSLRFRLNSCVLVTFSPGVCHLCKCHEDVLGAMDITNDVPD
jgi:hypothetical protein